MQYLVNLKTTLSNEGLNSLNQKNKMTTEPLDFREELCSLVLKASNYI